MTQAHVCGDILIGYDSYYAGQFDLPTGLGGPNEPGHASRWFAIPFGIP